MVLGDSKTRLRIIGKGTIECWVPKSPDNTNEFAKVILTNVQHVQGINRRFLSISTFDDWGFELHMKNRRFAITKGKAAIHGHRYGKLYIAPMYQEKPYHQHSYVMLHSAETALSPAVWHQRMAHLNWEAIKAASKPNIRSPVLGICITKDAVPHDSSTCAGCQEGKAHCRSHPPSKTRHQHSQFPIQRIHSDVVGPIQTTSIRGHHYAITFTCDKTSHTWSLPLKSKDQVLGVFKKFVNEVQNEIGLRIGFFRSDRGGEFMGKEFDDFLALHGIIRETSAPYTPEQNGLAEQMNQTLWSGVRALLHHSGMSNGFWAEALAVAVHVVNRSPRKRLGWRTPHEAIYGTVPDISYFQIFGCKAWVHNDKGKKLDPKAKPMTFIGYEPGSKAYCLWDSKEHKIVVSTHVTFSESEFPSLPPPKPVKPIAPNSRDALPYSPWSEGASHKKQVAFVDLPEFYANIFDDEEEEVRNTSLPVTQTVHTTQKVGSVPQPASAVASQATPPVLRAPPKFVQGSSRGSPPAERPVLRPTTKPVEPPEVLLPGSPTLSHQRESDEEVQDLLTYSSRPASWERDELDLSFATAEPPSSPRPPVRSTPTPSTLPITLSEGYVSPSAASLHSDDSLTFSTKRESKRIKKQKEKPTREYSLHTLQSFNTTNEELTKVDDAYDEQVKLFVSSNIHENEPSSYAEATHPDNPHSSKWIEAINAELNSLKEHDTWTIVPRPPKGTLVVSCKWVWRIKTKADGSVERYKARLVARGFTQTHGVDFNETFAPVTRLDTLRLLTAMAVQNNWEFCQIDVKTAYLNGDLEEDVYMEVPQGLGDIPKDHVLKLQKALYGLKQARRQWYFKLKGVMTELGMKKTESDPHTFVCHEGIGKKRQTLIVPIYVDDLFPIGDKKLTNEFERWIPRYFETTIPICLGSNERLVVTRNKTSSEEDTPYILLNQMTFLDTAINNIAGFYGEIKARNTVLPITPLEPNPEPKEANDHATIRRFQSAVGQLMYLMLATRPDIAYAVGMLARHASNPTPLHIQAVVHLCGYLLHTKSWCLGYWQQGTKEDDPQYDLFAYTDADWAGEVSSARSTSGYIFILNSSAISWSSKCQGIVLTSTTESEYIGLFNTAQQFSWFAQLSEQLGFPISMWYIHYDNQAAIHIASGQEMTFKRSKFMNVKYHYIRDQVTDPDGNPAVLKVFYVKTEDNIADVMTKRLNTKLNNKHTNEFLSSYDEATIPDHKDWDHESSDAEE